MNAIDTNILIYDVDYDEASKQAVAAELCQKLALEGDVVLPWQVLAEFARWLTSRQHASRMKREEVLFCLNKSRHMFPLAMPKPACLDHALDLADRHTLSHWDSMLVAACLEAGVTTLYTEDMGPPRKIGTLELINPFSANPKTS